MLDPSRGDFAAVAKPGTYFPVSDTFHADMSTPVAAYLKIAAHFPTDHFLLESVEGGETWARYSFIGFDPVLRWSVDGDVVAEERSGKVERRPHGGDPLADLQKVVSSVAFESVAGVPRLSGGAVGHIAYDYVRRLEKIPSLNQPSDSPEAHFIIPSTLVVFDNVRHAVRIVVLADAGAEGGAGGAYDRAVERIAAVRRILEGPVPASVDPVPSVAAPDGFELTRDEFMERVLRAKAYIRDGEIIQAVLSNRATVETDRSPAEVYRVLRMINPSPYMYLIRFGDRSIVGSSPEVLVRVEDGVVRVRPIAGTRPRGKSPDEDRRLEADLLSDPKEIAEHVMLVDLGRNDVGRVSEYGSVKVDELMVVERYSHVMHIVSNVTGRLRKGLTAFDALRATFPAGTVSGAPKVRAMQVIEELEPCRRGVYAGAVGYFDPSGNMDFCIGIRTLVMADGVAVIQAGAGIVADSDPEKEWEEVVNKSRVLFAAAGGKAIPG